MLGKYLQRIPRLFQWFPTVVKSLILWKRKRATSLFAKPWRQKAPHFPAQKLEKLKMGPHSSKKRSACIYEEVLEAIQVSKQPGGLGLRACLFSSLNSSCWDQMSLALLRGSSCNKRLSLGFESKLRNTQFKYSKTSKAHKRNPKLRLSPITKILKSWFNSNSEFGCIWFSLVPLPWDFIGKNTCLQKATFQSPRTNKWYDDCKERGHCRLYFPHQFTRHVKTYEGRSKFVVERKCVTKLVSPLSFYMVSCFYIISSSA